MNSTKCKACGKEIYFLKTSTGRMIPVNAESISQDDKDWLDSHLTREGYISFDPKKGYISHFVDCPEAKKFRKKK